MNQRNLSTKYDGACARSDLKSRNRSDESKARLLSEIRGGKTYKEVAESEGISVFWLRRLIRQAIGNEKAVSEEAISNEFMGLDTRIQARLAKHGLVTTKDICIAFKSGRIALISGMRVNRVAAVACRAASREKAISGRTPC